MKRPTTNTEKPITPERIEAALDHLAEIMVAFGDAGAIYIPLYERLERELVAARATEAKMAAIHEHAKRVKERRLARRS